jgi:hypothetical protein
MSDCVRLDHFVTLSADLTAFTEFELRGTGQAQAYLAAVDRVVGPPLMDALLRAYQLVLDEPVIDIAGRDDSLRRVIFSDELLGPIARNVIKLWYVGTWYEMPGEWYEGFASLEKNVTFMVSAAAYTDGLLWPAIGGSPPGAKAPGYGSWADEPRIPPIPVRHDAPR